MQTKPMIIFVICFIYSLTFASSIVAKGPDANTMAMWTFDETSGDVAKDSSGKGHDLPIKGDHKWVAGKFGKALWFSKSAFIEYKSHPDLSFKDGMTIEFWLNLEDITPQSVVGIPRKESEYVVAAYEQGKGFYMGPWINNGAWVGPLKSTVITPYGEWHHHATTYDGKELKVYVDGKQTGAMKIKGPMQQTDAPFRISNSCCGGRFFVGTIDNMRISNIPRTEAEIKELMESGIAGILAVKPSDKLATTWSRIKSE